MYTNVLVPTDGSTSARAAADAAISIADRFDATIHVVHFVAMPELPDDLSADFENEAVREGRRIVSSVTQAASEAGIPVDSAVENVDGRISRAIARFASDHDMDLVIMGTAGRQGWTEKALGSVTERTLRVSTVPILTINEETRVNPALERILVPTDGSQGAMVAVDHAIKLAVSTGASLSVLSVVDTGFAGLDGMHATMTESLESYGQQAVNDVIARAKTAGLSAITGTTMMGPPAKSITMHAAEENVDCIVMGTHGRAGIERLLLGSVTEKVVRRASIPVISIRGPDTTVREE